MKSLLNPKIKEIYKLASDDWYPCFDNNQVRIRVYSPLNNGKHRVCIRGADDFGMEIDVDTQTEALAIFDVIKNMNVVTKNKIKSMGFINA